MRWGAVVALLWVALRLPAVGGLAAQARTQDTQPGLAVLPFDNGGSYGQDRENFDALQKGIAGMRISALAQNPAARVVEREEIQKLLDQHTLGAARPVDPQTAAKLDKLVGARYVVLGMFIDFYGEFRVDARLVNVGTSEIVRVERDQASRDRLYQIIQNVVGRLMKDANLPPLGKAASDERLGRQIPTEALTYYSRALLYQDRGQKDKAVEMYQKALGVFPQYGEAQRGLERVKTS
jgi:TolB-like protein